MSTETVSRTGEELFRGKTKVGFACMNPADPTRVVLRQMDTITAGDGAKKEVLPGKGALSARTTCNVFRLLKECDLPVAFDQQLDDVSYLAPKCEMLPFEVVVRRAAYGSYLKRNPHLKKGQLFPQLIVEFYLKTTGRKWGDHDLPCDDPFIVFHPKGFGEGFDKITLYRPTGPIEQQEPFLVLEEFPGRHESHVFKQMASAACRTFLVIEKAWQLEGKTLVDFKVEFGWFTNEKGERVLLLADEIENGSWRVLSSQGEHLDKQLFREGSEMEAVLRGYHQVAEATDRFRLPRQRIVIWTGSQDDNKKPLEDAIVDLIGNGKSITTFKDCEVVPIVMSTHKKPVDAYLALQRLIFDVPDSVVIALIGRSNGAGPTFAANTVAPVIAVPYNFDEFQDDVWSSLRMPSDVPLVTVTNIKNAALAAVQILAMRNPRLYERVMTRQQPRLSNIVRVSNPGAI